MRMSVDINEPFNQEVAATSIEKDTNPFDKYINKIETKN